MSLVACAEDVSVRIETGFAESVLEEVCSASEIDDAAIRQSVPVQDMLAHFSKFRDDFTIENYIEARKAASVCATHGNDIFRFGGVIEKRDELGRQIAEMSAGQVGMSETASDMLRALTPRDVEYDGSAILMIGTPSCGGWSNGPVFYVDVPCLDGDADGLLFLIAHETYHGVQDLFMPVVDETAPSSLRLFDAIIMEGSALHLADFSLIEDPGRYSELNQDVIIKNRGRMAENLDLLDMMVAYLEAGDSEDAYKKVYTIGASGLFDAPLYAIGDMMVSAVRARFGAEAVVCLMALPANHFVLAYERAVQAGDGDEDHLAMPGNVLAIAEALGIDEVRLTACLNDR
ncbi:MAG: DUF5700 domain-containing putative Zn-dependent protease [Pseudomonadota bacterium]